MRSFARGAEFSLFFLVDTDRAEIDADWTCINHYVVLCTCVRTCGVRIKYEDFDDETDALRLWPTYFVS